VWVIQKGELMGASELPILFLGGIPLLPPGAF